jgi:Methyltransferase domain
MWSPENTNQGTDEGAVCLINNVDPYCCRNLRRVGGHGDGPKWTCDPLRLAQRPHCLINSVGSQGVYIFEDGMVLILKNHSADNGKKKDSWIPNCEIHVFGPDPSYGATNFYTFAELQQRLGHAHRRIDILKIDSEHCGFSTYRDWLDPAVDIRQVFLETHYAPEPASQFLIASWIWTFFAEDLNV